MEREVAAVRWDGSDLILRLRVQPRARSDGIVGVHGDSIRVRVSAPAVEGLANAGLISLLAECFGVPKNRVTLLHGHGGRTKLVRIVAPTVLPQWV